MGDIAHSFDAEKLQGDLAFDNGLFGWDEGLKTAVLHSLFSDARVSSDEAELVGSADPRGWWGAQLTTADDDNYGSRLWLLTREKQTAQVLQRAIAYAEEALAWMVEDGLCTGIEVQAEWQRGSALALAINLELPGGQAESYDFEYPWSA
jgi:phage gp46-like protein